MKDYRYLNIILAAILTVLTIMVFYAYAESPIQSCTLVDGGAIYTNKDVKGCTPVKLPELSIVPSYDQHPSQTLEHNGVSSLPMTIDPEHNITINDSLCSLYDEWMILTQRTLGGFTNNSVADTQRRLLLVQLFGAGVMPMNCTK